MMLSLAPHRQAVRWMRLCAVAAVFGGLLLGLQARPALAASDPQLTVTVTQRWLLGNTQGTWTPYVVTVADNGPGPFTGDVFLLPSDTRAVAPNSYPRYRASISVARGSQRSV